MIALRPLGGYVYLTFTILFTIYGQVVMKWQVSQAGASPASLYEKLAFLAGMLIRPWVLTAFCAAFLAALCWMLTLTRLPLGVAYPFMSLAFVGTIMLGALFFGEPLTPVKYAGMFLLVAGISLLSGK
jgi:multidrug transporter EmrE-like cation transporter